MSATGVRPISPLSERGMRSASELGSQRPHGIRMRYMAGCRCLKCRMANSNYETSRVKARASGDCNGVVDASAARKHVRKLSREGVGYKMVAEASGIASSILFAIRNGTRPRARARTITSERSYPSPSTAAATPHWCPQQRRGN